MEGMASARTPTGGRTMARFQPGIRSLGRERFTALGARPTCGYLALLKWLTLLAIQPRERRRPDMSNIEAVNALITAINFDKFAEIEAHHAPGATFVSFRGPTCLDSIAIGDWHREFLEAYADCNYQETEYIEQGDTVVTRATITAKGTDWREFSQRVVEIFRLDEDEEVIERRLYGMLPDLVLDKPATAAMTNATGFKGGSTSATKSAVEGFFKSFLGGDFDTAKGFIDPKGALIDSLYGIAVGPDAIADLLAATPKPIFGSWRVTNTYLGAKDALVELAIDPSRPRLAAWVRIVDGKIAVIENYWMFREIGVDPFVEKRKRHVKQVILPT